MATPDPLIAALNRVLSGRRDIELALLFGSRSRGQGRAGSDADLAIQGAGVDRLALARDLSLELGVEFDVLDLERAGYALLQSILRDSVVVHEGNAGAASRWRADAEARLQTDRPGFERMRDALLARLAAAVDG